MAAPPPRLPEVPMESSEELTNPEYNPDLPDPEPPRRNRLYILEAGVSLYPNNGSLHFSIICDTELQIFTLLRSFIEISVTEFFQFCLSLKFCQIKK